MTRSKLVRLAIRETSGVDHPANATQVGGEGWMVMKADGTQVIFPSAAAARAARKRGLAAHAATDAHIAGIVAASPEASFRKAAGAVCSTCGQDWPIEGDAYRLPGTNPVDPVPVVVNHPVSSGPGTATTNVPTHDTNAFAPGKPGQAPGAFAMTKAAAWGAIEEAAAALRQADPSLSAERAVAKATEARPDLVAAWRTAPVGAVSAPVVLSKADLDPGGAAPARVLEVLAARIEKADGCTPGEAAERALATPAGMQVHALALEAAGHHDEAARWRAAAERT